MRDAGWCPSGFAVVAWRARNGARRRLLLGALGKGAAIPLGLLAISGSIVLMPVGLELGFHMARLMTAEGPLLCEPTVVDCSVCLLYTSDAADE